MAQVTARIAKDKYKTILTNGRHEITADEPVPMGQDTGPTPYDFLLMSLGSCTAMTLRMYADRKNWDLQEVEVNLNQDRIHGKDCENCESDDDYVHIIEKEVKLVGNLDARARHDQNNRRRDHCSRNKAYRGSSF